jgi:hypothetical protein
LCVLAVMLAGLNQQDDLPVFGKEVITLAENNWVEVRPKLVPMDGTVTTIFCSNACRGGKHILHEQCDASCDKACAETHKYDFNVKLACRPGGDLLNDSKKFGLKDATWEVVTKVSEAVHKEFLQKGKICDVKHWNKTPCSTAYQMQKFKKYKIQADYQFFRNDIGPDGRKIYVKGPTGTWDYGTVEVPDGDLEAGGTVVKCACSVVKEKISTGDHSGVYIEKDGMPQFATSKMIDDAGITVECGSMNECTVLCINPSAEPINVSIGVGTVLECIDESCQDEMLCQDVTFACESQSNGSATFRAGPAVLGGSGKGRAACLNLHKQEPRSGVKYRIAQPSNASLAKLAAFTSKETIQGPWGQVRMWIVTDHASIGDIGKVLIPKPTESIYMRALYDVSQTTRLDLSGPEFSECVSPSLALGGSVTQAMTEWFVDFWSRKNPKLFATWVSGHANELSDACLGPNATSLQVNHVAELCNALCRSGSPEMAASAFAVLEAAPESRRADIIKAHGLAGALGQLGGKDAELAERALKLAATYRDAGSVACLLNVGPTLSDDLRTRAAKLYKELGGG